MKFLFVFSESEEDDKVSFHHVSRVFLIYIRSDNIN